MTIILNIACFACGGIVATYATNPEATPGARVFWGVVGVLAILRGIL